MTRAPISINIHDSHFGIWQNNAQDPTFNEEVFQPILKSFQKRGWRVTADPQVYKHHRRISKSHRIAAKDQFALKSRSADAALNSNFGLRPQHPARTETARVTSSKPTAASRDLIKAGALIIAEIERLDRLSAPASEGAV